MNKTANNMLVDKQLIGEYS